MLINVYLNALLLQIYKMRACFNCISACISKNTLITWRYLHSQDSHQSHKILGKIPGSRDTNVNAVLFDRSFGVMWALYLHCLNWQDVVNKNKKESKLIWQRAASPPHTYLRMFVSMHIWETQIQTLPNFLFVLSMAITSYHCNTFCTSSFMNDIIFSYNMPYVGVMLHSSLTAVSCMA